MKKKNWINSIVFLLLAIAVNANPVVGDELPKASALLRNIPVQFVENKGQLCNMSGDVVPFVLFKVEAPDANLYITESGLTYTLFYVNDSAFPKSSGSVDGERRKGNYTMKLSRIDMLLKGAIIKRENIVAEERSESVSQYFLPHCPDGVTDVHSYKRILIKDIYPGIDWLLYNSDSRGFKYDFVVHPGADPDQIEMDYSSAEPLKFNSDGSFQIRSKTGTLVENPPYSYSKESNRPVESSYQLFEQKKNDGYFETAVRFQLKKNFPRSQTLVIDPQLVWSTYYGGSVGQSATGIVCDKIGSIFISGSMGSPSFPSLNPGGGAYYQPYNGLVMGSAEADDALVMKFSNNGVLLWSTFYGGNYYDYATAISIDGNGNIFVGGVTNSTNFPLYNPGGGSFFQGTLMNIGSAWNDNFILKFSNSGVRLWATYFGGTGSDGLQAVSVDLYGNVFVSGSTQSADYPLLNPGSGAYFDGTIDSWQADGYLMKFSNAGVLLWSTYVQGTSSIVARCDCAGNLLLTGYTSATNLPVVDPGAGAYFQATLNNQEDAYIGKFSNSGVPIWLTYYGGSTAGGYEGYLESGEDINADSKGNIFVCGKTNTPDFPVFDPGGGAFFQGQFGMWLPYVSGFSDAFILKFDANGVRKWGTFFGTTYDDSSIGLAVDPCDNVYWMVMNNGNVPFQNSCTPGYIDSTFFGSNNLGIFKFNNNGVKQWATYWGGDGTATPMGPPHEWASMATDNAGDLFVTGWDMNGSLNPSSFPTVFPGGGAYMQNCVVSTLTDVFISKFKNNQLSLLPVTGPSNCNCGGTASVSVSGGCPPYQYSWLDDVGNLIDSVPSISGLCSGHYTLEVRDASYNCKTDTSTYQFSTNWNPYIAGQDSICFGDSVVLSVLGGGSPLWNNGSVSGSIVVTPSATSSYSVIIDNGIECIDTLFQSVVVKPKPVVSVNEQTICAGATANLVASGATAYSWSPGATTTGVNTASVQPLVTNTYSVVGTTDGCSDTAESTVWVNPLPVLLVSNDTIIGGGTSVTISASGSGGVSWFPTNQLSCSDCLTPVAEPLETTTYCAYVVDSNGCSAKACVTVYVEGCGTNKNMEVPNAFTPNNDGNNDALCLSGWDECVSDFKISIYDRWGELVFESPDAHFCWDGRYKDQQLDSGVFVYFITATLYQGHRSFVKKGNISLIR